MEGRDHNIPQKITVTVPPAETAVVFFVAPGQVIHLDLDVDSCNYERQGESLVIGTGNGGYAVLEGFFDFPEGGSLPEFELQDGEIVEGGAFLDAVTPELFLETGSYSFYEQQNALQTADVWPVSHGDHGGGLIHGMDSFSREPIFLEDILDMRRGVSLPDEPGTTFFDITGDTFASHAGDAHTHDLTHSITTIDIYSGTDDSLLSSSVLPFIL